jgi:hypothetical protein
MTRKACVASPIPRPDYREYRSRRSGAGTPIGGAGRTRSPLRNSLTPALRGKARRRYHVGAPREGRSFA